MEPRVHAWINMPWRLKINTTATEWRKTGGAASGGWQGRPGWGRGEGRDRIVGDVGVIFHVSYIFNFPAAQAGWKGIRQGAIQSLGDIGGHPPASLFWLWAFELYFTMRAS